MEEPLRYAAMDVFMQADGSMVAWHSGSSPLVQSSIRPHLHLGTLRQAQSRGGRVLCRVVLRPGTAKRLRDKAEQEWCPKRLRPLERSGIDYAVYLNRHEGVDLDEVAAARVDARVRRSKGSIDGIPDMLFRTLIPSAQDSLIIIDPNRVVSIEIVDRKRSMEAFSDAMFRKDEK